MSGTVTQQASRLAARLPAPKEPPAEDAPRVVFPSPLSLTRQQELELLQHAKTRLDTLSNELGRPVFDCANFEPKWSLDTLRGALGTFMGRQYFHHLMFHGRVDWRANDPDSIYAESNLHLPLARRILTQQIARAISYVTGTEPWWSAYDIGSEDLDFSKKLERALRHALHTESDLTSDVNLILELAFIQGQQVVKVAHHRDVDYYETVANVAIGADGQPVIAADGDYIFEHDEFVTPPPPPTPPTAVGEDGLPLAEPVVPPALPPVLKRDLRTPRPPVGPDGKLVFKAVKLTRDLEKFNGPKTTPIFYLDFLAPLDAPSLEDADCLIHLYDRTVIQMAHQYLQDGFSDQSATEQLERVARLVNDLLPRSNQGAGNESTNAAREEHHERPGELGRDREEPVTHLAEVWLRYDANGDGTMEHIMLLMDREGQVPLYYDYVANLTPDGRRPFRNVSLNKIAGRWHGQSQMDVFGNLQEAADLLLNRWNWSQSSSARVDFWRPHLTVEGKDDPNLKLNGGTTYTPANDTIEPDKILKSVHLADIKSTELHNILEFLMQMAMNMSGISNVNDSRALGLDTAKLATGVRNLERSGQELFGKYLADLTPGIKEVVVANMECFLAHLDRPKTFRFFEGDMGRLGNITPEEVRSVKLDVRVELTRYRGEQEEAQAAQATAIFREFYQLPVPLQMRGLSLYRQRLQALQIRNVDELLQPFDLNAHLLAQQAGALPAPAEPPPAAPPPTL